MRVMTISVMIYQKEDGEFGIEIQLPKKMNDEVAISLLSKAIEELKPNKREK